MSYIAARIAAAFLFLSILLAGDRVSTADLPPPSGEEASSAVHAAYWPLIYSQRNTEPQSPEPLPGLQDTGAASPGSPVTGVEAYLEAEQALSAIEALESIAREVYVQGKFILPITQQPEEESAYVSSEPSMITQFGMAARNGVTGLLAHNYLSGALFYLLDVGQEIHVLYADRQIGHYQISEILTFQKLQPADPRSDYLDMQTGKILSTSDVFHKVYRGEHHLTLQTCLEQNGNLSWGLYFVIAVPIQKRSG